MNRNTREMIKLIAETVFITVAAFFVVVAFLFLLLTFTAPAAMAKLTGNLGMYRQSAWYSSMQYSYSKDVSYISDAFNYGVMAEDNQLVIEYGTTFIQAEGFEEYCDRTDERLQYAEGYEQYVYGTVSIAYYDSDDKDNALRIALQATKEEFEYYNAVTDLLYRAVYEEKDKEFANTVLAEVKKVNYEDEQSKANVALYTANMQSVINTLT